MPTIREVQGDALGRAVEMRAMRLSGPMQHEVIYAICPVYTRLREGATFDMTGLALDATHRPVGLASGPRGVSGGVSMIDLLPPDMYPTPDHFTREIQRHGLMRPMGRMFPYTTLGEDSKLVVVHPAVGVRDRVDWASVPYGDVVHPTMASTAFEPQVIVVARLRRFACTRLTFDGPRGRHILGAFEVLNTRLGGLMFSLTGV